MQLSTARMYTMQRCEAQITGNHCMEGFAAPESTVGCGLPPRMRHAQDCTAFGPRRSHDRAQKRTDIFFLPSLTAF